MSQSSLPRIALKILTYNIQLLLELKRRRSVSLIYPTFYFLYVANFHLNEDVHKPNCRQSAQYGPKSKHVKPLRSPKVIDSDEEMALVYSNPVTISSVRRT